jgi:hypothetical protein
VRTPNIRATGTVSGVELRFSAPTREDAERILRKNLRRRPHVVSSLVGVEQPRERFTASFVKYSADDEDLLRALARIGVCYAREVGVPVAAADSTLRFSRGDVLARHPVAPVRADVVAIPDLPPQPLYHALFLSKPEGDGPVHVYVVLFEFCEFVVGFAARYPGPAISAGHMVNLVSGLTEERPFRWLVEASEVERWIAEPKLDATRVNVRGGSVAYYLRHPEHLWIERANLRGMAASFKAQDRGVTAETAMEEALREANQVLMPYGLQMDTLDIRECS